MKMPADSNKYAPYYAAVRYLESLGNISGGYQKTNLKSHPRPEMFLERMRDFLDLLDNPENGFKYVHITGTAGKGSVAAAVHQALVKAGKRSGLFTSPFTVSTIEKIQTGEKYVDPLIFAKITDEIKPQIDKMIETGRHGSPSYFEMMLAIALLYFKKEKCEYAVLEVGLGGRYDATNIIKYPLITAITNIGLDHTNILGSCREDIAEDKSGIIKKGSVFFTTEEDKKILEIFENACEEAGAQFNALPVKGLDYAARNLLLANSICAELGLADLPKYEVSMPNLPARFEIVSKRPLIVVDGAHNPSKIKSTIHNLKRLKYKELSLVLAVSADKDWKTIMRMIAPLANGIYATRFSVPGRQPVNPRLLLEEARKCARGSCSIELFSDPMQAFHEAEKNSSKDDLLLVTGSFYLAGDIRKIYCPEERILRQRSSLICG